MNLEKFECQRCNACCRQPGFVYLKPEEVAPLAEFLNLEVYSFTDRFCEVVDRRHLVLKKYPDERCIFLTEQGCSVHAVKPGQCRDFPVKWRTLKSLDYCEGLKRL
jgi:Fe-S-cluster containining protein